jgi:hypothetical protein
MCSPYVPKVSCQRGVVRRHIEQSEATRREERYEEMTTWSHRWGNGMLITFEVLPIFRNFEFHSYDSVRLVDTEWE